MELYDPILPSITWMYVGFILRVVGTIAIVIILCAVAVYYSVLYYRTTKKVQTIQRGNNETSQDGND